MSAPIASRTMAYINVGHSFSHLVILLYPTVVLALEPIWNIGFAKLLPLGFAGYLLFGLAALPAGWLGDRWDSAKMIAIFFLGTGTACILAGLAVGPVSMAVALTLIGLFASIYHPVALAWVVGASERPGRALGINGVFGAVGTASAALLAGFLADVVHWRAAFILRGCRLHAFRPVLPERSAPWPGFDGARRLSSERLLPARRRHAARLDPDAVGDPFYRHDFPDECGRPAENLSIPPRRRGRRRRDDRRRPGLDRLSDLDHGPAHRRPSRRPFRRAPSLHGQLRAADRLDGIGRDDRKPLPAGDRGARGFGPDRDPACSKTA